MADSKFSILTVLGIILGGLLLIVGALALYVMSAYNGLVRMDVNVKTAWSQVENQLQRRNDLIPNLVNTVKGFAAQEKSIFTDVANARAKLAGAASRDEQIQAANGVSSALGRLLAIVENYPQLKSDANFRQLMDELAGTENRIAVERMRYNETVAEFNKAIRVFPRSLIAGIFGFKAATLFEAAPGAKEVPKVEF
jgi:LemA protein